MPSAGGSSCGETVALLTSLMGDNLITRGIWSMMNCCGLQKSVKWNENGDEHSAFGSRIMYFNASPYAGFDGPQSNLQPIENWHKTLRDIKPSCICQFSD